MNTRTRTHTLLLALTVASPLVAQELESLDTLDSSTVIGDVENIASLPGSGYYVDSEDFRTQNFTNINRVLARVPGVYFREEDGYGNFPNISIRGGNSTRSSKTTIMEDGILTVPAPYSAPAAYYAPKIGRMSGLEVLKGSSQIKYGPNSTGGVVNYLSTQIPSERTFYSKNTYGTDNTILSHSYFGDTVKMDNGEFGYLLELFHNRSDGFRKIEGSTGYAGSDKTGFRVTEPMIKLGWTPDTALKQSFEFKFGYTDFNADESYLGLSEADAIAHPDRRYAATRFDNMDSEHQRMYFRYNVSPSDKLDLAFTAYHNTFERDWHKLSSSSAALQDPAKLAILQGRAAGTLPIRHNAREYKVWGLQLDGKTLFDTGSIAHKLEFGARFHSDNVMRDQYDDIFSQDATGAITNHQYRLNNVRKQETDALAFWLKDTMEIGKLKLTPGVRVEHIHSAFDDYKEDKSIVNTRAELQTLRNAITLSSTGTATTTEVIPGISFNYEQSDALSYFGGVHRGISLPGPRSLVKGTDIEESIGYELGARYQTDKLNAELVAFRTDFERIIGTQAGFANDDTTQGAGETRVWGLEALVSYDLLDTSDASMPVYFSATYTNAEFQTPVKADSNDGSLFAGALKGNTLPYTPEWKIAAGIGYQNTQWGAHLDATYTSTQFATGVNDVKLDALFLVDLSANYALNDNVKLIAGINNLFDTRAITSRVPYGPRINQGRSAYTGFEIEF